MSTSNFDNYKLDTQFHGDYVTSPNYEWESSIRRQKGSSRWKREREIGAGAFGIEKNDGGQLRAVKSLHQKGINFFAGAAGIHYIVSISTYQTWPRY